MRFNMKAVLFDFDYTLGDSTNGIVESVNYALEKMAYQKRETTEICKTIGLSLRETYKTLTEDEKEAHAEKFAALFKEKADLVMVANTTLYDGVTDMLDRLRKMGYRTGIVTTKYHDRIEQILRQYEVQDKIDVIVGGDDVRRQKPDPEGILYAARALGVCADEILYVGDSLTDARAAESAKVGFAAVLTGTTCMEEFAPFPHVCIASCVDEIETYLKEI